MIYLLFSTIAISAGLFISFAYMSLLSSVGIIRYLVIKNNSFKYAWMYKWASSMGMIIASIVIFFNNITLNSDIIGKILCVLIGFFYGLFVGFLVLALAEVFDIIPVVNNKLGFRFSLTWIIVATAFGKFLGTLVYYLVPGMYKY